MRIFKLARHSVGLQVIVFFYDTFLYYLIIFLVLLLLLTFIFHFWVIEADFAPAQKERWLNLAPALGDL